LEALTQGSQSLALGLILAAAPQLVEFLFQGERKSTYPTLIIQLTHGARKHYNSLEFKVFFGIQLQG
jgi:hypothetical protein